MVRLKKLCLWYVSCGISCFFYVQLNAYNYADMLVHCCMCSIYVQAIFILKFLNNTKKNVTYKYHVCKQLYITVHSTEACC